MNRAGVIDVLKQLEPQLRDFGVSALYLYGSYARDEARPDSDIDILVEFTESKRGDFAAYMAPYHVLEESFPDIDIGYGTRENIVPIYLPYIERGAVRVF